MNNSSTVVDEVSKVQYFTRYNSYTVDYNFESFRKLRNRWSHRS